MLLEEKSILNYLPENLNKRQFLILDSVRFTLNMIDFGWTQLNKSLKDHSTKKIKNLAQIFLNTWSVIDNIHRFVKLYEKMPSESNHKVLNSIRYIKTFRHTYAHIDERIDESMINTKSPFYGALLWKFKDDEKKKIKNYMAISGINYGSSHSFTYLDYNPDFQVIFDIKLESVDKKEKKTLKFDDLFLDLKTVIYGLEAKIESQLIDKTLIKTDWRKIRDIIISFENE